jgi:excisionase family DNA binding protein
MLSVPQVAKKLGVCENTICQWVKDRKIPYFNLNGVVRFQEESVDTWLQRKQVKQKQTA